MATTLGLAPAVVNEMEWRDVADLYRYWAESPPTHELVAGYLGYKAPASSRPVVPQVPMTFAEMKAAIDGGKKRGVA